MGGAGGGATGSGTGGGVGSGTVGRGGCRYATGDGGGNRGRGREDNGVPGQLGTGAWEIPRRMKNPSISWVVLKGWSVSQPPPLSEGVEECPPEEREAEWAVAVERVERRFRPAGRSSSLGWLGLQ